MIAIDLGSNTIRFIEFDGENWGESFEKIVRTAQGLHQTKRIGESAIERIVDAINEAKEKIDFSQPIWAYTTAAMRLATNADEVLTTLYQKTGIEFKIITAAKEAELTLSAVRYRLTKLSMEPNDFILVDIGGGSTELIHCSDDDVVRSVSLNMGIVTLSESARTPKELQEKLDLFKAKVVESLPRYSKIRLVLTAGTPTTIAAYLNGMDYTTYDPQQINGYILHLDDCYRVYDELIAMDEAIRSRYVGVGRENLIIAGIKMVCAMYESLETNEAIIIDDGLREGIALEYYN